VIATAHAPGGAAPHADAAPKVRADAAKPETTAEATKLAPTTAS